MTSVLRLLTWPAAFYIAYVSLGNERYKLTGHPAAVWLFTLLSDWLDVQGYEKPFRLLTATLEIAASLLVLVPLTRMYGAALALGAISGAIFLHVFSPHGLDPANDGGKIFTSAVLTWLAAAFILFIYRDAMMRRLGRR